MSSQREEANRPEWDRGSLTSLLREVQATHLFVWATNAGGVLVSTRIPTEEIAQKIRLAGRIAESNPNEAMGMIRSAATLFDNAAQRWESQARQSEEKLRAVRAAARLNEAKARHNSIRTRIIPVQNLFRRALQAIQDAMSKS